MPNIPLSLAPRGTPRILPLGVAKESLAAPAPNRSTLARARELASEIEQGDWTEALAALARHKHALTARLPALDIIVTTAVSHLRLSGDPLRDYTGRLLYVLGVARSIPDGREFPLDPERVGETTRRALVSSFTGSTGADREAAAKLSTAKGAAWAVSEAAARYVSNQDVEFVRERWLTPYRYDYVFQESGLELNVPSETTLAAAFAGFDKPIETDDEAEFLHLQVLKGSIVPRMLAAAWPEAIEAAERLVKHEPLLAHRQDFADILVEARRLLDVQQTGAS
jgi:hypothetical protein